MTTADTDVSGPYFEFSHANGEYSIGNNGWISSTMANSGSGAVVGCKCAFPVGGGLDNQKGWRSATLETLKS
jgi:hypothetical protein